MATVRRTYRSKKDSGGVLERRDLLQNLDEKSSAFDAFFIQNIKQTKRELSCVASSNPYGGVDKRKRKKKYVKRIVKQVESPCRVGLDQSTYLTPDKSIRVNKPMDPFDMLLNSSPVSTNVVKTPEVVPETSKHDLFDQIVPRRAAKRYTRKKVVKPKRYNSSSYSSDSDKENSNEVTDITRNASNIKTHQLVIEKDQTPPKCVNDSIHNIVNNLPILNKFRQNSFNTSFKNKFSHRLTKNILSPILQKSPLCSTPYKLKYRDPSIYKFSPISNVNEATSDSDKCNDSLLIPGERKELEEKLGIEKDLPTTDTKAYGNTDDEINQNETEHETLKKVEVTPNLFSDEDYQSIAALSSLQTTESEPLLGFSNNKHSCNIVNLELSFDKNDITKIEVHNESKHSSIIDCNDIDDLNNDDECITNDPEGKDSNNSNYNAGNVIDDVNSDNDTNEIADVSVKSELDNDLSKNSNYDDRNDVGDVNSDSEITDGSQKNDVSKDHSRSSSSDDVNNIDEIKNNHNTNDSADNSNKAISNESESECNDTDEDENVNDKSEDDKNVSTGFVDDKSLDDVNNSDDKTYDNVSNSCSDESDDDNTSLDSNNSLYDTCTSNISDNEEPQKELVVEIDRMNDSSFMRYYEKMKELDSDDNDKSVGTTGSDEPDTITDSSKSDIVEDLDDEDGIDIDNEIDEENETSNDNDDKCISFVTTRRRNEATSASFMSMLNDSYPSSTECDNTVLSNKETDIISKTNNIELEINKNNPDSTEKKDLNEVEPNNIYLNSDNEEHNQSISTRFSNITDRRSSRRSTLKAKRSSTIRHSNSLHDSTRHLDISGTDKPAIFLQPGKKWERSLSIYRRITMMTDHFDHSVLEEEQTKGRKYRQSVISTMEMQDYGNSLHNESINSRRSTFVSKPNRSTIRFIKDPNNSRLSLSNTSVLDDLKGFLNEECDDTIIELSKLSIGDQSHEVTVVETFHDTSHRVTSARDYVLRRCNQTDAVPFDECYPESLLKNCHKIGEGVYGEVFLWRDRDGRARVLKVVPIAGTLKVNGECQKDFHEVISEIVIAMELSALRAPIAAIERHFDEGKPEEAIDLHAIENATDIFNEVLAVRCVYGSYPSRLLDLWDLYDECKGSENDNPAILPPDQQFIVLELANAGQDLESYQFNNAEQAHALFLQVAYGLAVAEESFQFEHRDLHWGNVLIAPTDQKYATFVLRGRRHTVPRGGVRATIIDYSLSRVSLALGGECAALYNDLANDDSLFDAVGDYQFAVYRLMRDKLGNDWKNFEPYTNILWLHYTVDKMITALRYKRINTKIHKHYIDKLKGIKSRILNYGSAALFVLTDNEI